VHASGVVHRDVKPSNFLLRRDGRVVLTDFGVACTIGTRTGQAPEGTLAYMAPEQRRGDAAHPSFDVFALGLCLKELIGAGAGAEDERLRHVLAACLASNAADRPSAAWVAGELGEHD
jgi:serine/threonine-protein kinase